ncbi:MAG: DNA polymerase III subunit epsilon [Candidatus Westeberhardia cardiocondylae]|nr:DNA polymerase III subunit epsilon [Candidatus Westeberhardia cardiocondylae]
MRYCIISIMMRQVALDTETTGMNKFGVHYENHRIIEIGAVEIINRRVTGKYFHVYLNPRRYIDVEAFNVHGISDSFLLDKPTFGEIVHQFLCFIRDSELICHNAPFDLGFINYEISMLHGSFGKVEDFCKIIDTLKLARKMFPGKRNNLNALCERYSIDNAQRTLHSALLDSKILANVFLRMTSGQISMDFFHKNNKEKYFLLKDNLLSKCNIEMNSISLHIIDVSTEELLEHQRQLFLIKQRSGFCMWLDA